MKNAGIDSTIFSKIVISEKEDKKVFYQEILEELEHIPSGNNCMWRQKPARSCTCQELGCSTIQMQWGRGLIFIRILLQHVDYQIRRLSQIKEIIENL